MPVSLAPIGEILYIKKIKEKDKALEFLHRLGCIEGEAITVVSKLGGNIIINIKGARIALDKNMANRIIV